MSLAAAHPSDVYGAVAALPARPGGDAANTLTITQAFHEWVHHLQDRGWQMADASRGKPSYPADRDALSAMQGSFASLVNVSPYGTSALGEPHWQALAAEGLSREYGLPIAPETVAFTPGGQFGLAAAFYAIERNCPGGVVLTPQPWYLNHEELASLFSAQSMLAGKRQPKFIGLDLLGSGGRITPEMLEGGLAKARASGRPLGAFLFCNPSNPLGTVTRRAEWEALAPILRRHPEVPILLDEAFAEIVFDEDFQCSLLHAAPDLLPRCFLFRSGTKALGLAGERLAATLVPLPWLSAFTAFQSRLLGNAPLTLQAGMGTALARLSTQKKSFITQYYRSNYAFLRERLQAVGLWEHCLVAPEGAFFLLLSFPFARGVALPPMACLTLGKERIENDIDLAFALMMGLGSEGTFGMHSQAELEGKASPAQKQGLAVIPASAFGVDPERLAVRVSFSSSREELTAIAERLAQAVQAMRA